MRSDRDVTRSDRIANKDEQWPSIHEANCEQNHRHVWKHYLPWHSVINTKWVGCQNYNFFQICFGGHQSFMWGHWYTCFGQVMSGDRVQSQGGSLACMLHRLWTMNFWDSPPVQHLLTSWWPKWWLSCFDPHTCTCTRIGEIWVQDQLCHCFAACDKTYTPPPELCQNDKLILYENM